MVNPSSRVPEMKHFASGMSSPNVERTKNQTVFSTYSTRFVDSSRTTLRTIYLFFVFSVSSIFSAFFFSFLNFIALNISTLSIVQTFPFFFRSSSFVVLLAIEYRAKRHTTRSSSSSPQRYPSRCFHRSLPETRERTKENAFPSLSLCLPLSLFLIAPRISKEKKANQTLTDVCRDVGSVEKSPSIGERSPSTCESLLLPVTVVVIGQVHCRILNSLVVNRVNSCLCCIRRRKISKPKHIDDKH